MRPDETTTLNPGRPDLALYAVIDKLTSMQLIMWGSFRCDLIKIWSPLWTSAIPWLFP